MVSIAALLLCTFMVVVFGQSNVNLQPQYDDFSRKIRVYTVHRPLVLFCDVSPSNTTLELTWKRDGLDVRQIPELQNRFEILATENKFVIDRTVEDDQGLYTCELSTINLSALFNVVAHVASRIAKETQLIEGESLWIVCRVIGSSPTVTWILPDKSTLNNSTDRVILEPENGISNSALYIASVRMEDRGNYTCIAENDATSIAGFEPSGASGMVRIRSKLAPLWPVCGIIAQCFVLFVVLYIYEKYFHEKDDLDDDEEDYMATKKEQYNRKDKAY